jgi:RsiW-degrading membrane proteinase PrsW (M82 family)
MSDTPSTASSSEDRSVFSRETGFVLPGSPPGRGAKPAPEKSKRHRLPPLSELIPVKSWIGDRSLRSGPVYLFVVLVCLPSVAFVWVTQGNADFTRVVWVLAGYFAFAWLLLIWIVVQPRGVSLTMLAAVGVVAFVTEVPLAVFLERTLHATTVNALASIVTVGLPEEIAKALPVALLAYLFRRSWGRMAPVDYLFLGAFSGLIFGSSEAVSYVVGRYSDFLVAGKLPLPDYVLDVVWRLITDSVIHACWAGISCYFIGLAVRDAASRWWLVLFGVALAAVLHGLNDSVAGHWSWIVVVALSVLLFLAYARAGATAPADRKAASGAGA